MSADLQPNIIGDRVLITLEDAARLLSLDRECANMRSAVRVVRRLILGGQLVGRKVSRYTMVDPESVLRLAGRDAKTLARSRGRRVS